MFLKRQVQAHRAQDGGYIRTVQRAHLTARTRQVKEKPTQSQMALQGLVHTEALFFLWLVISFLFKSQVTRSHGL